MSNPNDMNRQFQNMQFNPNAQSFNPNANSFTPGGGRGGYRGGYQGNNYNPNYNPHNNYQGGYQGNNYNPNYHQGGGYQGNNYNPNYQGRGSYNPNYRGRGGGYHHQNNNNQYYQQQQQNWRNQEPAPAQISPNPAAGVAVPESQAPQVVETVPQTQKVEEQPVVQSAQNEEVPDDWDDEPETPTPETTPAPVQEETPAPKQEASPKKVEEAPKQQAKPKAEAPKNEEPAAKPKEQKESLAKVTLKADAIPENIRKSKKEHLNVVFIGHVDAGKSTIGGQILKLTGMVDARTLEKFEREAKEKNRESWYLSWCLDQNQEERDKGKTVECGRAFFETEKKHFTILDAPGHKSFVANMITGASQADVAVLVISARKGEFEAGFEKSGQTREHAMLVKTAGIKKLVILINKMDEQTVNWSKDRYDECCKKLTPFLKKSGYKIPNDIHFIPGSGQTGINILESRPDLHPYYKGKSLINYLDDLPNQNRNSDPNAVRLPIIDRYRDMGLYVFGKLEAGQIIRGQTYTLMPNKQMIKVAQILTDDEEVDMCQAGENVKLKIEGVEEEEINPGFVICNNKSLCHYSNIFDVKLKVMELNKPIMAAGFKSILHVHQSTEEVVVKKLICKIDVKTGEKTPFKRGQAAFLKNGDLAVVRLEITTGNVCLETFSDFERMGRISLRDEGRTIAMGTIAKVLERQ